MGEFIESITSLLWITYLILLIILMAFLIYTFLYPNQSFKLYDENIDDILYNSEYEDYYEIEQINDNKKLYIPDIPDIIYDTDNFNIVDYEKSIDTKNTNNLIIFQNLIKDKEFIKQYKESLLWSMYYKQKRYTTLLKDIRNEIKGGSNNNFLVNIKDDRNKLYEKEFIDILKHIKKRIDELNSNTSHIIIQNYLDSILNDPKNGLNTIVGRNDIKEYLCGQIINFGKNPKLFITNFQNILIYGNSGVGKTKLAEIMGFVYCRSGIFARQNFKYTTKNDFTTGYVDESSNLTRNLLLSNLEGVLFIDEAYGLISNSNSILGNNYNHGEESITEMVNFLDKFMGLSVVCMAGYKFEMESRIINSNQGLERRFPNKLELTDYNSSELTQILTQFIHDSDNTLDFKGPSLNILYTFIDYIYNNYTKAFDKQAGSMKILSSHIINALYNNTKKNIYSTNNILKGFNSYLSNFGYKLEINSKNLI